MPFLDVDNNSADLLSADTLSRPAGRAIRVAVESRRPTNPVLKQGHDGGKRGPRRNDMQRAMRRPPIRLSVALIVVTAFAGFSLWWVERNANSRMVQDSTAYLVGARTAISAGRPIWICTYGDIGREFDRMQPVSSGTCPNAVRR